MPRACSVFNLIPVFFDKNVRILHVTGSILENPVRTRHRVTMISSLNRKQILFIPDYFTPLGDFSKLLHKDTLDIKQAKTKLY